MVGVRVLTDLPSLLVYRDVDHVVDDSMDR